MSMIAEDSIAFYSINAFACDATARLHQASFPESPWSAKAIAECLCWPGGFGAILVAGNEPMGFVLARVAADEAEILSIGVPPAHRRSGYGRRLLDYTERHAAGLGAAVMFLEVAETNRPALGLYDRCGYEPVGRRAGYYRDRGDPVDALVLRKRLAEVADGQ